MSSGRSVTLTIEFLVTSWYDLDDLEAYWDEVRGFAPEVEWEVELQSITPSGTFGVQDKRTKSLRTDLDDLLEAVVPKDVKCGQCYSDSNSYWCDACAAEHSIDCMGVEDFLDSVGATVDRRGTLVIVGQTHWWNSYDGDWDEEFDADKIEWQP